MLNVNLISTALLARALLPELEAAKGLIVNVTSIAGSRVHPFAGVAYAASKAGLASLTRELAHEFGPRGVRANAIAPGEIETNPVAGHQRIGRARSPDGSAWNAPRSGRNNILFMQ
ncbi:NAD(P)-dependent dehydrogenase (short-subunit alcohol dehydrogenase family) [Rhizobium binae]|uniref:NAD(P)-dependent dehydrogenase (Short-subunit alcohol dehydrogenase family) n=1 Tax=Rhizobium binae TaxID=1138190 RepID=A0ABV2MUX2_9HYPH